ncbi:MAG TPA: hypothetical protein VKV20_14480 [Ktedonobacteraceae bacterium]|jgi:hypothetical protein|nr:hypothetical protein [Ktedonobacteraceae bacterium]
MNSEVESSKSEAMHAGNNDTSPGEHSPYAQEEDAAVNFDRADPVMQSVRGNPKAEQALRLPSRTELRNLWFKEYGEQDYALQMWVRVVEQQDLEIEMMLQMQGMLIFGLMVSTQRYAQFYIDLNEELHRENEPETADALRDYYTALIPPQDQEIGPEGLPILYRYIHMRDVTIMSGGHKIKLPYWRGKLSSVDAFVVGATAEE